MRNSFLYIQPGKVLTISTSVDVTSTRAAPLAIDGTLDAETLNAAAGSPVSLGNGGTLALASGGTIASLLTNGSATVDTGGPLSISGSSLDAQGATGTFTKLGDGTLSLDNTSGTGVVGTANTTFDVGAGTLDAVGLHPLGASTLLTLSGGTASFGDQIDPPAPPPAGAIGIWTFDGDNANDSSANANHGTVGGSLTFQTDTPLGSGKSLRSQSGGGAGNVVTVPTSASLESINDRLSVAYWMKSNLGDNADWVRIVQHGTEAGGDRSWLVDRYGGNNDVNVRVDTTGAFNQNIAVGGPAIFDNSWHHVVFTLDSGAWNKYEDGVPVGSGTYNHGDGLTNTQPLYMFGGGGNGQYVGALDEIHIYDRALTAGEVAGFQPVRTPPDMSSTDVLVTANSTLHSQSTFPLTFRDVTLNDGTRLATTGGDMTFRSVAVAGGAGRRGTLAPENSLDTDTYSDGGTATALVMGGSGTLTLNTGGVLSAAATTFEAAAGTLAAFGANPLGGSTDLVLSGGTARFSDHVGAPGPAPAGAQAYYSFDNSGNPGNDDSGGEPRLVLQVAFPRNIGWKMVINQHLPLIHRNGHLCRAPSPWNPSSRVVQCTPIRIRARIERVAEAAKHLAQTFGLDPPNGTREEEPVLPRVAHAAPCTATATTR